MKLEYDDYRHITNSDSDYQTPFFIYIYQRRRNKNLFTSVKLTDERLYSVLLYYSYFFMRNR